MLTKEQLFQLINQFNFNLYNYRHEQGKAWEVLWKEYTTLLAVPSKTRKNRPTVLSKMREETEGQVI